MKLLKQTLDTVKKRKTEKEKAAIKKAKCKELFDLIQAAQQEINIAQRGFESASDKDLTDYFIHQRIAAEIRYTYLLKQYKIEGYAADHLLPAVTVYHGAQRHG